MSYDAWLEAPYADAAQADELEEVAHEHGFDSWEEYEEALESAHGDVLFERKREREMFGDNY